MRAFKQLVGSASILYYIHIHYYTFLFFWDSHKFILYLINDHFEMYL